VSLCLRRPPWRERLWDGLRRRPLAWAALAAALGVVWGGRDASLAPAFLTLLALGAAALTRRSRLPSTAALLIAVVGFFALYAGSAARPGATDLARLDGRDVVLRAEVVAEPVRRPHSVRLLLRARSVRTPTGWRRVTGKALYYDALAAPNRRNLRWGDRVEVEGTVRRPRPARNPSGFDARAYWARRGVHSQLRRGDFPARLLGEARRPSLRRAAARVRRTLAAINDRTLTPGTAHLENSILLGVREAPAEASAPAVDALFRRSGTIHLLVVSGAQLALLVGPLLWLGLRLGPSRWAAFLLVAAGCWAYALLAGLEPSISRAAVMMTAYAGALVARRRPEPENVLGLAALALLAVNPLMLGDLGFALSFAAVWALFRLTPLVAWLFDPARERLPWLRTPRREAETDRPLLRWLGRGVFYSFVAAVAVYLCVAPLLAAVLQVETPISVIANVGLAGLGALLLYGSAGHLALAGLGWEANPLRPALEWTAAWATATAGFFARQPGSAHPVLPLAWWVVGLIFACLLWALWACPRERRRQGWAAVGLSLLLGWAGVRIGALPPRFPTAYFLDVGQGSATLLRYPNGVNVLVDGGPPDASPGGGRPSAALSALLGLRVRRLDLVALSHPDADHVGGLPSVLEAIPAALICEGLPTNDSPEYDAFVESARRRRVPRRRVGAGEGLNLRGVRLEFLAPARPPLRGTRSDANNNSVVVRAPLGGAHVLLPGDAERELEARLLAMGPPLQSEVLALGHHGSRTSSSEAWLRRVRPLAAIASVGRDNRFHHPAPEVVARVRALGARVYRTDVSGMITVRSEPGGLRVRRFLGASR